MTADPRNRRHVGALVRQRGACPSRNRPGGRATIAHPRFRADLPDGPSDCDAVEAVAGDRLAPLDVAAKLARRYRLIGVQGIVRMALAGLDVALWDALSIAAGLPLVSFLGGSPRPIPAYNSNGLGLMAPEKVADEAEELLEHGFRAVKLRLGRAEARDDLAAVRAVRRRLPDEAALMVDYNQALSVADALAPGTGVGGRGSLLDRRALDFALDRAGVPATPAIRDRLMKSYLDLDLYPETLQALKSLTEYKLAILSNGSPEMLDLLVEASGVRSLLDEVISVDQAKSYKPDPRCYELAPRTLGVAKHEVLFVSSNGFDVAGAKRFGFHVAWVERGGGAMPPSSSDVGPTELFRLLRGGAERLGLGADKRVEALTDLPRVLAELAK
jgi:2-haloacid dehalogenase